MLKIDGLTRPGLNAVSLDMEGGECVAIRGKSGAGKSLLLRAIADLDVNAGHVTLDGRPRADIRPPEWRRAVCYVPAESGWWHDLVGEHFEDAEIASGYLPRLGFPSDAMSWPVRRLSTGEKQRLALMRAMVQGPRVLLLDEPTSALDPEATAKVESLLREKLDSGVAVIMVSHDEAQSRRMARRRYVMRRGTLQAEGAEQ